MISRKDSTSSAKQPPSSKPSSSSAPPSRNGIPNIKDVARRAGVSVATVSFVLNETHRHKIRPETQRRVLAAVAELGYSPNISARNLAVGRSHILGVIVSDIRNPFFPEITAAFQEAANLSDMEAIVMNTNYDAQQTRSSVNRLLALQVPGVAVLTSQIDSLTMEILARKQVCAVYLDLGRVDRHVSNIAIDYENGINAALEHVRGLGHTRIGFIGGPSHLHSSQRRKRAFQAGVEKMRALETRAVDSDFTVQGGYSACARLLSGFPATAIVSGNDLMAIGIMHCAYDRKMRIPADLSVVGFDNIKFAEHAHPPLTTVAVPRTEIGQVAFQTLRAMILNPANSGTEHRVETQLVVRDSTAAAPLA